MYDLDVTYFGSEKQFAQEQCLMEPYERYGARTETSLDSRAQKLDGISAQQKLPSFRDIIPAHLHNAIESTPQSGSSELQSPDQASANTQSIQQSRSVAPSPVQSQTGSMPAMSEAYDEFGARGADGFYMPPQQARRMSDHTSQWVPSTQYPEISTTMIPQPSMYQQQVFPSARASPNLPPPRDAHGRPERIPNGYDPAYGIAVAQYPSLYAQQTAGAVDLDQSPLGPGRTPHLESSQRPRQTYPQTSRNYASSAMEYPRYGSAPYDPYRASTPYQASYADLDYGAQPMHAPQHSQFSGLSESMDSRNKRRRGNLPKPVTDLLKEWLHQHLDHPYPSEEDKQYFISRTGLSISQISNWFINARRRQVPSIKSNRDRTSHSAPLDHRAVDRLLSHDPSLSPR